MPDVVRKAKKGYVIVDKETREIKGHSRTKKDAESSARARNAARHGWKPTGKKKR